MKKNESETFSITKVTFAVWAILLGVNGLSRPFLRILRWSFEWLLMQCLYFFRLLQIAQNKYTFTQLAAGPRAGAVQFPQD